MTDSVPHHQDAPLRGLLPCTCGTQRRKRRANPSEVILFRQRSEASCESSTIIKSQGHLGLIYVLRRSQENNAVQENLLSEKNNLGTKSSREAKATILNVYKALNASSVLGAPPIFTTLWLIVAILGCQGNPATGCLQRLSEDRGGRLLCSPVWLSLSDGTGLSPTHRAF